MRKKEQALKNIVKAEIERNKKRLIDLSILIHDNPEPGLKEYKASKWLSTELKKEGFAVTLGITDFKTAFKAVLKGKKSRPVVALIAEYDALPEIGHGCGHNIIGLSSVGAAIGLAKVISNFNGTLVVLGTPGEEHYGSKVGMIKKGIFKQVDVAMMVHPFGRTIEDIGLLGLRRLRVEFQGKSAHASACPEKGVNALEGIIQAFNGINALRQHLPDDVRIHGIITKGGVSPNVVPDCTEAIFYVRAQDKDYLEEVVKKVKNCCRAAALSSGGKVKISSYATDYQAGNPNVRLMKLFKENIEELGVRLEKPSPQDGKWSSDIGNVSQILPTIHPYICVGPSWLSLHTPEFTRASISQEAHRALIIAAKAMATTTVSLLTNPEIIKEIKKEFGSSRGRG